jgi:hypothetical protein
MEGTVKHVNTAYKVEGTDQVLEVDSSRGHIVLYLPDPTVGKTLVIRKTSADSNNISLVYGSTIEIVGRDRRKTEIVLQGDGKQWKTVSSTPLP